MRNKNVSIHLLIFVFMTFIISSCNEIKDLSVITLTSKDFNCAQSINETINQGEEKILEICQSGSPTLNLNEEAPDEVSIAGNGLQVTSLLLSGIYTFQVIMSNGTHIPVTLTVNASSPPLNEAPSCELIDDVTISSRTFYGVQVLCEDPENESLTYLIEPEISGASIDSLGNFSFQSTTGVYTIVIKVTDESLNEVLVQFKITVRDLRNRGI
jgi:hypothetical protein